MTRRNKDLLGCRQEMDEMLARMGGIQTLLEQYKAEAERKIRQVKEYYDPQIAAVSEEIKELDKAIQAHAKTNKKELFDGRDRVDLQFGALIHSIQYPVKRARGVLESLKKNGLLEAIKVVESVKWEELEKWTDEQLVLAGTKRNKKESFSYEIF